MGRTVRLLAVAATAAVLAGCSTELPAFTAGQVQDAVAEEVASSGGGAPEDVECGPLEPEENAISSCVYTLGDLTRDVDITVSSVVDSDVEFRIEVTRTYLTPDQLTALVAQQRSAEGAAGEVTCLDPLDLDDGARVYCAQVEDETTTDLAVTAASGADEPVALEIEVDDREASESGQ